MRKSVHEIDMCSGAILPKLIIFAIPLVLTGILQLLFNAADMVVVGKFGSPNSLAAVGSTGALVNLIVNLFIGLSTGANAVIARHYGAKNFESVRKSVHTAIFLSIVSGFAIMILGIAFSRPMLIIMGAPTDVIDLSVLYLKIYFIGAPFNMFYNFGSAILRAIGDTKRPMIYISIAGVINVVLNLIFVIVFGLDVAGVAIATVISQAVSALFLFVALVKQEGAVRLFPREIKLHTTELLQIIRIGIPGGIQSCVFSLSNVVIQSSINYLGTTVMSASAAAANIEGFVYIGINAFFNATLSFVSQNFGRHDFPRIKKIIFGAVGLVTVYCVIMGIAVNFFAQVLLGLYMSNELLPSQVNDYMMYGAQRLAIVAFLYFICGIMDVIVGALRGFGKSLVPMISSLCGVCGIRLVWIFTVFERCKDMQTANLFGFELSPLQVLLVSYPISWTVTALIHTTVLIFTYRKNKKQMQRIDDIKVVRI